MKPVTEVMTQIERRLQKTWHQSAAGDESAWPFRVALGQPDRAMMTKQFDQVQRWAFGWDEWARVHGLELAWKPRKSGSTRQPVPSHVVVPDVGTAARVVGGAWPNRLKEGRTRYALLEHGFPEAPLPKVVRDIGGWPQVDLELLIAAAHWFRNNPRSGLSPRQVPIEGLHSKWLNTHQPQVAALAGLDELGLIEPRSTAVHFTYLDPTHRASGGRLNDSVIPGDPMTPAYVPQLVIITENKDTAILFPAVDSAISVQGNGKSGPGFISRVEWMRTAQRVIYWGDIDADGFEIVNAYRTNGVPVETILMDLQALLNYSPYSTTFDSKSQLLRRAARKPLPRLTGLEAEAYHAITDPHGNWPIRIEQERIPLAAASELVHVLTLPGNSRSGGL